MHLFQLMDGWLFEMFIRGRSNCVSMVTFPFTFFPGSSLFLLNGQFFLREKFDVFLSYQTQNDF